MCVCVCVCVCGGGQAAYLVGVSDPNSQAGHQGLVDPIQFAKANQAIHMACQNLVDPDSNPSQVIILPHVPPVLRISTSVLLSLCLYISVIALSISHKL